MAVNYLKALGLNDLSVELNSLGCPECRETFKTKLKEVTSRTCHDFALIVRQDMKKIL